MYMKLEKCKWKVREVEFLGVVIGPEGIKMEKEKVKGVLEWPIPKSVKESKVLGTGKLLPPVHRRVCNGGKAIT